MFHVPPSTQNNCVIILILTRFSALRALRGCAPSHGRGIARKYQRYRSLIVHGAPASLSSELTGHPPMPLTLPPPQPAPKHTGHYPTFHGSIVCPRAQNQEGSSSTRIRRPNARP